VRIAGLRGFPPIAGSNATCLILGSMPGAASLAAREYYAHPRNAFWPIAEALLGIPVAAPYAERTRALADAGIAVWDVLKTCRRTGSLDSAIETDSVVVNDFRRFLAKHSGINHVFFNGGTAGALFQRHVLPGLPDGHQQIPRFTLPSTSPANARLALAEKIRAWRVIRQYC
jgi:double-stranded uracil-DNA glycosylase